MKKRMVVCLLMLAMVLGMMPAGILTVEAAGTPEPFTLDFKEFSRQAQKQSFWQGLHPAANEDTVYIGKLMNNTVISKTEIEAYEQLIDWGMDTFGWTIDEETSGFTDFWKRLYFNGQDHVPWGFCMYTYYHAASMPERSKLALTVTAPADGWYGIDMSVFKENSSWPGIGTTTGDNSGGDTIAVYVNDDLVITDYRLVGNNISVMDHVGSCYLKKGENSVVIDSVLSYNDIGIAGRSNVPLQNMIFTPLEDVQVQEYLHRFVNLNETYLPFNAEVSGLTVTSADGRIAEATVNEAGVVTIGGLTCGQTEISVFRGEELLCTIPVTVTEFQGTLDELQGIYVKADFMTFADRAMEQSWWAPVGDSMLVSADDRTVTDWLSENGRWNLTDGEMSINGGREHYGVAVTDHAEFSVDIPTEGLYNVTVEYLAGSSDCRVDVGDKTVLASMDPSGETAVVKESLGAFLMEKGINAVSFSSEGVYLRAVTFTPLGTCQTEVGRVLHLVLNETYLSSDEDASGYTARATGTAASVTCENGIVTVTGKSVGEVTLILSGEKNYSIPVKISSHSDLSRVQYTADGFKAQTLSVGDVSEGDLTGLTEGGTRLGERYLQTAGGVYHLSSDPSVAKVDNDTGDITAVAEGDAIITAYVQRDGKIVKDTVNVVVTDDTDLVCVDVWANVDYVATGNMLQMHADGIKASGAAADLRKFPVSWSVDDEAVAYIDENGLLTGLCEGTVTVTATAGVAKMPITDTVQIRVVDDAILPTRDVILQLDEANVLDWQALSFESHGFRLNKELTYKGGVDIQNDAQGPRLNVPAGGAMAFDFIVKQSGWYQVYTQGKSLVSGGGMCYVYVDGDYVGFMDGAKSNSNSDAGGKMDTVWMDAGIHTIKVVASEACWIMVGRAIFYPTSDPGTVTAVLQAGKSELVRGETTELELIMEDENGEVWHLLRQSADPGHTNWTRSKAPDLLLFPYPAMY